MLGVVIASALAMAWMNGFHDAPNAMSTTIVTKNLPEHTALRIAAVLNGLGAVLGVAFLITVDTTLVSIAGLPAFMENAGPHFGLVLASAVLVSILWNVITWLAGIPSSSWHAIFGGLLGAMVATGHRSVDALAVALFVAPLLLAPVMGMALSFALTHVLASFTSREIGRTRHLRLLQTLSASTVALGHGINNGRLPMGIILVALAAHGGTPIDHVVADGAMRVPLLVMVAVPLFLALGTLAGAKRIIRTLGRRLTDLSTPQGLAAETSTALVLYVVAFGMQVPVSSSQTITSSIAGSAMAVSRRQVNWSLFMRIAAFWVLTPGFCFLAALLGAGLVAPLV